MPQPKTSRGEHDQRPGEALADRKLADKADQSRQHAAEGERYKTVPRARAQRCPVTEAE